MKNKTGNVYGLTLMCPILSDPTRRPTHVEEIREVLAGLPNFELSPLARIPTIHMARFFVVRNFPYAGYPAEEDHLRSSYLMFSAEFDGDLAEFVEMLTGRCGELVESLWSHCVAYPGPTDPGAVLGYFRRCQLDTALFFADQTTASAEDVLRALYVQREVTSFVEQAQVEKQPPAALQSSFRELVEKLRVAPTPPPGSATLPRESP